MGGRSDRRRRAVVGRLQGRQDAAGIRADAWRHRRRRDGGVGNPAWAVAVAGKDPAQPARAPSPARPASHPPPAPFDPPRRCPPPPPPPPGPPPPPPPPPPTPPAPPPPP